MMLDSLRRMVGAIKVEERDGVITVGGIHGDLITRDIARIWSTSKINAHMFLKVSKNAFHFHSFFAVEVLYLLRQLMEEKLARTSRRQLFKIIRELEENTWLRQLKTDPEPRLDFQQLNRLRRKALPTQLQFLETYNQNTQQYGLRGYILSAAPGSGKTFTNLLLGACLKVDHHIVISPKNAVYDVWKREILDWVKDSTVWVESEGKPYRGEEYLVCHYEALPAMLEASRAIHGKRVLVTLDESHHLNELTSLRTQLFIQLCREVQATDVIWSSGTPLKALGYEIIPILRTIDPLFIPAAEERFRAIFGRNAPRGLDILNHRIGLISFKVTKDQIRSEKPTSYPVSIKIPNGDYYTTDAVRERMRQYIDDRMAFYQPQMREMEAFYNQCVDYVAQRQRSPGERKAMDSYRSYIAQIRKGFDPYTMGQMAKLCNEYEERVIIPTLPDRETRARFKEQRSAIKYLNLKIMGEALGNVLGKARVECHMAMTDHIDFRQYIESSESKTVIFTSYVEVLKKTEERLRAAGYEPVVVYGKTNKDLEVLLERFKSDEFANPILATYKSLSTAVPLVSASTTIFIDQPFRDYIKTQAESRTDRLGQEKPVRFFNVTLDTGSESNISTRSNDILAWSKAQVEAIMGTQGSAVEIDAVDKYYEGFESMAMGLESSAPYRDFEALLEVYFPKA